MGFFDFLKSATASTSVPVSTLLSTSNVYTTTLSDAPGQSVVAALSRYNPWVSGSIRAITQNALRPRLIIRNIDTQEDVTDSYPELIDMFNMPNAYQDYTSWLQYCVSAYLVWGRVVNQIIMVGKRPAGLLPIPPSTLSVSMDTKGNITYMANTTKFMAENIIDWRDTSYVISYYEGYGRITHLSYQLALSRNIDSYNSNFFENGAVPSGILTSEKQLNATQLDDLGHKWSQYEGSANAGKTPILSGGLTYVPMATSHKDIGFESLKAATKEEILAVMQVPPVLLGQTKDVNRANAETQRELFWEITMIPILTDLASSLDKLIPINLKNVIEYAFDFSQIIELQSGLSEKLATAQQAYNLGYTRESITEQLGIPFEIGDVPNQGFGLALNGPEGTHKSIASVIMNTPIKDLKSMKE